MVRRLAARQLESQVMGVLWDAEVPLTPGEVHERLPGGERLAYTTVMTILVRLWKKKLLQRVHQGRAYAYSPTQSRGEYAARRMHEILTTSGASEDALARFIEGLDPEGRAQLRSLLKGRTKK